MLNAYFYRSMNIPDEIDNHIASLPVPKRSDMQTLHSRILGLLPGCKLWYEDGRNSEGKIVSNPNIGYGSYTINYANGAAREFFQVGISANTTGISAYIMGLPDKTYLPRTYGDTIGKATVTGYCIKFKKLVDVKLEVLDEVIRYGVEISR